MRLSNQFNKNINHREKKKVEQKLNETAHQQSRWNRRCTITAATTTNENPPRENVRGGGGAPLFIIEFNIFIFMFSVLLFRDQSVFLPLLSHWWSICVRFLHSMGFHFTFHAVTGACCWCCCVFAWCVCRHHFSCSRFHSHFKWQTAPSAWNHSMKMEMTCLVFFFRNLKCKWVNAQFDAFGWFGFSLSSHNDWFDDSLSIQPNNNNPSSDGIIHVDHNR